MTLLAVAAIGLVVGFVGGLFGKGGSALATPLLHAVGVRAIVAVAAPLPATIPSTLVAGWAYRRAGFVDRRVVAWVVGFGVPATVVGSLATRWIRGDVLVVATDVVLLGLGLRLVLAARGDRVEPSADLDEISAESLVAVAVIVGVVSGLLANSGGFLLAPLFVGVLNMPIKAAFASSLAVAAVLAVPGTVVHAGLGHIDWSVVAVFGATSVPLSFAGARVAIAANPQRLERLYGAVLVVASAIFIGLAL